MRELVEVEKYIAKFELNGVDQQLIQHLHNKTTRLRLKVLRLGPIFNYIGSGGVSVTRE